MALTARVQAIDKELTLLLSDSLGPKAPVGGAGEVRRAGDRQGAS